MSTIALAMTAVPFRQVRQHWIPVRAKRQWFDETHGGQRQRSVEMRKQSAAARRFPFQCWPKCVRSHSDQQQVGLSDEVPCCRLRDLITRGEMDVAISEINARPRESAGMRGVGP